MNALSFPPLAALPARMEFGDSIIYQVNGLVVVFGALALIWGLLEVTGIWFKRRGDAAPAPAPVPAATGRSTDDGELAPELVAVITAAVHATVGAGCRIEAIVPVGSAGEWASEGRRQIFASHQVR